MFIFLEFYNRSYCVPIYKILGLYDAPLGLEPRFTPSKGAVLPLDEGAIKWIGIVDSNHGQKLQRLLFYR
jgi:hypothetical protein